MSDNISRRGALGKLGAVFAAAMTASAANTAKCAVQKVFVSSGAPHGYDPFKHKWVMAIDINRCIGCGLCAEACKKENLVPEGPYFRTWIERYIIPKPKPGSAEPRGEAIVDSPNGGIGGFPEPPIPKAEIEHSFFVPKLCNLCDHSPCVQVCPVGATFDAPDGAVLIDPNYCIGCGFCIQACPYGCRFFESGHQDSREMHALLPPHHARAQAGVRGDLSERGAHFRGFEERGGGRSHHEVLREQPGAGIEAVPGHGTTGALRGHGQGGPVI